VIGGILITGEEISPQTVSRIAKELDEKVGEFLNRPVEKGIPYLFNEKSLIKLAGAILIDINEEWLTRRRYLVMGESLDIGFLQQFLDTAEA